MSESDRGEHHDKINPDQPSRILVEPVCPRFAGTSPAKNGAAGLQSDGPADMLKTAHTASPQNSAARQGYRPSATIADPG
jgi:hypothetical protein